MHNYSLKIDTKHFQYKIALKQQIVQGDSALTSNEDN